MTEEEAILNSNDITKDLANAKYVICRVSPSANYTGIGSTPYWAVTRHFIPFTRVDTMEQYLKDNDCRGWYVVNIDKGEVGRVRYDFQYGAEENE